ncbi:hypothetical protein JCM1841_002928 [Sporobolomyces salmonicolor]
MSPSPQQLPTPAPELEDELAAFRREWQEETRRRQPPSQPQFRPPPPAAPSTSTPLAQLQPRPQPQLHSSPECKRRSLDGGTELQEQLEELRLEQRPPKQKERERPRSALELYEEAVRSEREGRLNDALVNYRSAFRLDPDVDKAWHIASRAAQAHASSRGAAPHSLSSSNTDEWRFERTVQLGPDYEASKEHRPKEVAERETGKGDQDQTHPSSTSFLLSSLLKSIAENPYERPPPSVNAAAHSPTSNENAPAPVTDASPKPSTQAISPEEALASLTFIPADEELPLPLANLPREVLLLILRHLLLSSMLPPPRPAHVEEPTVFGKGKRALKKRTLKEEMLLVEEDLELENVEREWKSDVEALERFARVCRAARVLTLDFALWRDLCSRTYVPPQQIKREESAQELVKLHGNDWRRFYIEHPRIRLDGVYISVVTYLRRGEVQSVYAPTHLITFYRYIRFYHHGLVVSLLTTDPPANVVRRLNPSLQMQGLTLGRWRLRGDLVELWGLEDPNVDESRRKYSFRMGCRLKSSARGRMNKLEMLSLATEHRETLELEDVPIRPTKPFYFSKVQSYSGEDLL